jgi:starch phosphorylase
VVGQDLEVTAKIKLGGLKPEDLAVDVYYGQLDPRREIIKGQTMSMAPAGESGGTVTFKANVPCRHSGQHGFTVRVLPKHQHLANPYELGLILWR